MSSYYNETRKDRHVPEPYTLDVEDPREMFFQMTVKLYEVSASVSNVLQVPVIFDKDGLV